MSVLEATSRIPRRRDRALVAALLKHCGANGGILTPQACQDALAEVWERNGKFTPANATAIINAKLKNNKNIREALGLIYEEFGDFSVEDAVKKHVEHIQGPTYHERDKETGEMVEVRGKPSYPALKDYMTMVLPMPAKKVEVGMTVAQVGASMLSNVPAIEARALGPATVSDVEESQTVEFDEAEPDDES